MYDFSLGMLAAEHSALIALLIIFLKRQLTQPQHGSSCRFIFISQLLIDKKGFQDRCCLVITRA